MQTNPQFVLVDNQILLPNPPAMIKQSLLAAIYQHREVMQNYGGFRSKLLELHGDGALVEPGQFTLHVETKPRKQLSEKTLRQLLGDKKVDSLKARVAPTIVSTVYIKDRYDLRHYGSEDDF